MTPVEVDFEVFKALTAKRQTESTTYNDVIREMLGLPQLADTDVVTSEKKAWEYRGARFPHGTEFRATYKRKSYTAKVENGVLMLNGRPMASPSEAANAVTGTNVNGWRFWECKIPGRHDWRSIEVLRPRV